MKKFSFAMSVLFGLTIYPIASLSQHGAEEISSLPSRHVYKSEHIVSVDVKVVQGVVHLLLAKQIDGQDSLWYQYSNDDGATWSDEVEITAGHSVTARVRRGNDARLAVQGEHIVAVWMTKREGGRHGAGPMMAMLSQDAGRTWDVLPSPADWDGAHGFFAMDADDDMISLAWLDSRTKQGDGATQGLRYSNSHDGGLTWSTNVTLDERSCACCWNTAQYHDGEFYVLYRDKDPSDMTLGKVSKDQHWQALSTVGAFNWDFQGCPHIGGSLAFTDQQAFIHGMVGTGHPEKSGSYYLNSRDGGKTWSEPLRMGSETAVHSDLSALSSGPVLAAWDEITESGFHVSYAFSVDDGQQWSKPVVLSQPGKRGSHPRVVATDKHFLVFWTEGQAKQPLTLHGARIEVLR